MLYSKAPDNVRNAVHFDIPLCFFWGVYIRFCGNGGWRFRPYGGSLSTGPASGLFESDPP
ncbi:hypothetical protein EMIT0P228_140033 [Pseudomonas brassicacearum]